MPPPSSLSRSGDTLRISIPDGVTVEAKGRGQLGPDAVELIFTNQTGRPQEVRIPIGTVLKSTDPRAQDMAVY
jgi:hypothetical protein